MKKQLSPKIKYSVLAGLGCFLFLAPTLYFTHQVSARESTIADRYAHLRAFTEVLARVEKNYVEPVDPEKLVEGAIEGMLKTLDPHTSYLNKEIYKELQVETKGQFGGLGIEITVKDSLLTVVAPIEGSPASRAGVEAGRPDHKDWRRVFEEPLSN